MSPALVILAVFAVLLILSQIPVYRRNRNVTMEGHLPGKQRIDG
jgi:hypothetical protein